MKPKRHINEFMHTGFANSGRAAGHGMVEDRYDEESSPEGYVKRKTSVPIKAREEQAKERHENEPVKIYFIDVDTE